MAEITEKPCVTGLVPIAGVADVQRASDFYKLLGMEMKNNLKNPAGQLQWAWLANRGAELMVSRAGPDRTARTSFVEWSESVRDYLSRIHGKG